MDDSRSHAKKEKRQHIQAFVRVRPTVNGDRAGKSVTVVEVPSNREVIVRERLHEKLSKKFTFDKVFGSQSKQIEVYNAVVSPLVEEVLAGYNCTVFAYGQTGTGKTFTMEGNNSDPALDWRSDTNAGIIPRALSHLFDELRILEIQEYTVRVSFLELYNEEIFDLLSSSDDASKLRLYEDSTKKGTVIVHGLEEITVHNKTEVYKILEKGSEKRRTAATLMNAHSSRSHTVFSITIHIREGTIEGEELLKTGKLNLVDLAGSENIGRSGAVDRRAREAGNINQSLLTLGRVITALVERAPHVPYRESKLTRLLQESLGGRTKTSIIATISPASINLEETLSTLDYAYRAKNITNRPEANQKLSKMALLHEYTEEIEKLKKDLLVTRERNGVYLAYDNYNEMQSLIEKQNKEIEKKINHIKALQEAMETKEKIFNDIHMTHVKQLNDLHNAKNEIHKVTDNLKSTLTRLEKVEQERDEQKHLIEKHVSTETVLLSQAQSLLHVTESATVDVSKLHEKIYRKIEVEQKNNHMVPKFKNDIAKQLRDFEVNVSTYTEDLVQFCAAEKNRIVALTVLLGETMDRSLEISQNLVDSDQSAADKLKKNICKSHLRYQQWCEDGVRNTTELTEREKNVLSEMSAKFAEQFPELIKNDIAENLRTLNSDISRGLDDLSTQTKNHVNFIRNYREEESSHLSAKFAEIKETVENFQEDQNKLTEMQQNFEKTMENAYSRLKNVSTTNRQSQEMLCNASCYIKERCKNMDDEAVTICNTNYEKEVCLQERVESDVQALRSHVATETEKCCTVAEEAIDQSKVVLSELQLEISEYCDRLTSYRDIEEQSAREIQQKMDEDKNTISAAIDDMHMVIRNEGIDHAKLTEDFKNTLVNTSTELHHEIDAQCENATSLSNKIIAQLHSTRERLDAFFTRELQRDFPTGTTPAKRNFQYPRQLVTTSPHDRIIQRFREVRKMAEDSENEAIPLLNNNTPDKKCPA